MNKLELITSSLGKIEVYSPGETIAAEDLQSASDEFDLFIDKLNTKASAIFKVTISRFGLVTNQQTYTLGPTGDFNVARPLQVQAANLIFTPGSSETRRPINLLNSQLWSMIRYQNAPGPPLSMYADEEDPLRTLYFYPIPDQLYDLELYLIQPLVGVTTYTDQIIFPPGYQNMFVYNLAERLATIYGRGVPGQVAKEAQESRMELFGFNSQSPVINLDGGIGGRNGGWLYNYLFGQYTS